MQMVDQEPSGRSYQSIATETPLIDPAQIQLSSQHLSDFNKGNSLVTSFSSMDETAVAVEFAQRAAEECSNKHNEEGLLLWKKTISLLSLRLQKHELTAKANFELGKLLFERWERDSEAEEALRRSWESELNPASEQGVAVATMLGRVLIQNLKFNEALQLLSKAAEIGKECCPDSENTHTSLCYLSLALWKTNKEQEAAQLITLCRVQRSQNHPATISTALAFEISGYFALGCQQLAEAEHYYQTALTIFKTLGSNSRDMAIVDIALGMMYRSSERWTESESVYIDALETFGEDNPIIRRDILSILGAFYETLQRYSEAQVSYGEALELHNRFYPTSTNRANALIQVGALRLTTLQYSEAELVFKEALDIYNIYAPKSPYIGDIQIILASIYETLYRYPEAEQTYEAALETYRKQVSSALEVNQVRKQLEFLHAKMQTSPTAERSLQETLDLNKDLTPIQAARIQSLLGKISQEKRQYQDAEQHYEIAMPIFQSYDPTSAYIGSSLPQLEELYQVQERPAEPIQMYEAALLLAQTRDSMSIETGNILLQLALLDERSQQYLAAEQKITEALRVFQGHNATPMSTGQALLQLGSLCAVTDRLKEAQWHFTAVLALFPDPTSPYRRCVLVKLGSVYDRMRLRRSAYRVYQVAFTLYEAYDPNSVEVRQILMAQGRLCVLMSRFIEAEQKYKAALTLSKAKNPKSEDTADCFVTLGSFYAQESIWHAGPCSSFLFTDEKLRQEEAENQYLEAYMIYKAHDSTALQAASVLMKLGDLYLEMWLDNEGERRYRSALQVFRLFDPISASIILRKLAVISEKKKENNETERLLREAWELTKTYAPLSSATKCCMEELALFFERTQQLSNSQETYTEALWIHEAHDPNSLDTGDILLQLGKFYERTRQVHIQSTDKWLSLQLRSFHEAEQWIAQREQAAVDVLTEALRVYTMHDSNSFDTGAILLRLGKLYERMRLTEQAEPVDKEALRVHRNNNPVSNESCAIVKSLGGIYERQKRYQDAERLYKENLDITQSTNPISKCTIKAMQQLASLYTKTKQNATARLLYTEAALIYLAFPLSTDTAEKLLRHSSKCFNLILYCATENHFLTALETQREHSSSVCILLQLGTLYVQAKSFLECPYRNYMLDISRRCLEKALALCKPRDPTSPIIGKALVQLVVLHENSCDVEAAKRSEEAVAFFKKSDPKSPVIERMLEKLGKRCEERSEMKRAEDYYAEAFRTALAHATRPNDVQEHIDRLIQFYLKQFELKSAEQICNQTLERYLALDSTSMAIGPILTNLGCIYQKLYRLTEAEESYKRAIDLYKSHDSQSASTGSALFQLGKFYQYMNQSVSAEPLFIEAFGIYVSCTPVPCDIPDLVDKLSFLFAGLGRSAETEHFYKAALLACKPLLLLIDFGEYYLQYQRYAEAEQVFSRNEQLGSSSLEQLRQCYIKPRLMGNASISRNWGRVSHRFFPTNQGIPPN